jgi:hypothetical protein
MPGNRSAPTTSLRQMRYFLAVFEEGGLVRATRRVRISQPSLSNIVFVSKSSLVQRFSSGSAIRPGRAKRSQPSSRMPSWFCLSR